AARGDQLVFSLGRNLMIIKADKEKVRVHGMMLFSSLKFNEWMLQIYSESSNVRHSLSSYLSLLPPELFQEVRGLNLGIMMFLRLWKSVGGSAVRYDIGDKRWI